MAAEEMIELVHEKYSTAPFKLGRDVYATVARSLDLVPVEKFLGGFFHALQRTYERMEEGRQPVLLVPLEVGRREATSTLWLALLVVRACLAEASDPVVAWLAENAALPGPGDGFPAVLAALREHMDRRRPQVAVTEGARACSYYSRRRFRYSSIT